MTTTSSDYYQLSPDTILDALESIGLLPEAALLALNSYENRVYQFRTQDEVKYVAKFYRPNRWTDQQILEEHQYSQQLCDQELPVVPPLAFNGKTLHDHQNFRFSVFANQGGRNPNLDDPQVLKRAGRLLSRIHMVSHSQNFQHRPALNSDTFGHQNIALIKQTGFLPNHVEQSYFSVCNFLMEQVERIYNQFPSIENFRIHGDCHPSNILWTDDGPHFVDFDDCRTGPAVQDLWMLITAQEADEKYRQWQTLLDGYEEFCEFDDRELKLVEPLRALRMLNYTAWLCKRWDDPIFKHYFFWFNSDKYWEEQVLQLKEQLSILQQV